jgi:hypothetical protein
LNRIFHILVAFFLLLLLVTCAKIGSPTGGPKDVTPPFIEKSKPLNRSIGYKGKKIEITFDEFIRSEAISQEMIVSPPMEERPEIRMRGKTLVIEWQEELHDSTTYTFSFGESIKDLNEGNVLRNFEFVFSTGDHLDSLGVLGTVLQAFNLQPHEEKIFLMLYSNLSDSAPLLEIPEYVGRADEKGNFLINNVRKAKYRLFALQDLNRNYKYDVPEEFIGFLDSAIYLSPSLFENLPGKGRKAPGALDSLLLAIPGDSAALAGLDTTGKFRLDSIRLSARDSLIRSLQDTSGFSMADSSLVGLNDSLTLADLAPWSIFVDVFLFQEDKLPQYLIDNTRKDRQKLSMRFNRRVTDTVILEPLDFETAGDWYIFEEHVMKDTFDYWITDSMIYKKDSLTILATYQVTDSLMNFVPFHDTLRFNFREPAKPEGRRRKQKEEDTGKEEQLAVGVILIGGQEQDPFNPLALEMQHPLSRIDASRISLVELKDTLRLPVDYSITRDQAKLRRYFLKAGWEGQSTYKLTLFPGAFIDVYGLTNDTISKQIKIRNPEYYGRLLLTLNGVSGQKILQVLDSKKTLVRERLVNLDGLVEFPHMPPSTFTLKLIDDRNGNGKWDTGDYLEHRQPEAVEFNPATITIRSNFDVELKWDLEVSQKQDPPEQ